jgi:hypothetical protein
MAESPRQEEEDEGRREERRCAATRRETGHDVAEEREVVPQASDQHRENTEDAEGKGDARGDHPNPSAPTVLVDR